MWQIMLINVKIVAKTRPSCKCYMDGQRMNMYIFIVYIMHGPFGDIMLSHDLWLDVECNFICAIKSILIMNVGYNYFIATNWNHKLTFFFYAYVVIPI
jgi:hypothetical protein